MNDKFISWLFKLIVLLFILAWLGSWIGDILYSARRHTTDKKRRRWLRWLETIFQLPLHEFFIFGRRKHASNDLLDWQIEVIEPDIYLKRRNWVSFLFLFVVLLWFGGFLSFFLYYVPWQKLFTTFDWRMYLVAVVFGGFPSLVVMLICYLIPPYMVSKIQFKMNSKETIKTYLIGANRRTGMGGRSFWRYGRFHG
jgi:hypothetical protein